jgi:SAM-dependent methyltransferase
MKADIKKEYSKFHLDKSSDHLYPTEWIIRTMLGNYPGLKLNRNQYANASILDLGFGDGRNFSLLNNCRLKIFGVETTNHICSHVRDKFNSRGLETDLRVGTNSNIPFPNDHFDFILASSSLYYIDGEDTFEDNLKEVLRVLKPDGWLISNFIVKSPDDRIVQESFILKDCKWLEGGHFIVENDIYGIRNGYKLKCFDDENDLRSTLSSSFKNIGIGTYYENHYGVQINGLISASQKKMSFDL